MPGKGPAPGKTLSLVPHPSPRIPQVPALGSPLPCPSRISLFIGKKDPPVGKEGEKQEMRTSIWRTGRGSLRSGLPAEVEHLSTSPVSRHHERIRRFESKSVVMSGHKLFTRAGSGWAFSEGQEGTRRRDEGHLQPQGNLYLQGSGSITREKEPHGAEGT